jgi:hypothetical protein
MFVSGLADGELEFTIDPTSGELLRAIVLSLGATEPLEVGNEPFGAVAAHERARNVGVSSSR